MTQQNPNLGGFTFPLDGWIEGYIQSVEAADRSPRTVQFYRWGLRHFSWWSDRQGYTALDGFEPRALRQFLIYLKQPERWDSGWHPARKPLAPASVDAYVRALKAFASWLVEEGALESNPFGRVKTPRRPAKQPVPLTTEEVKALLAACRQHRGGQQLGPVYDHRDYALVLTLLDSGLRVSELLSMRRRSVSPSGSVTVMGKGRRERTVQVGQRTRRAIHRYIAERTDTSDALWMGIRGPLTSEGVRDMLRDRVRMAGITHVNPHRLRHTFGPLFILNGGDPFTLQRILGHSSLEMTRRYVLLADRDIADSHRRNSPADRLDL